MLLRVISSLLLLTWLLPGQTVENFRAKIRGLQFDPQQCYRVRDLMLEREDVKFYFTDGLLIFAQPIDGRDVGAFFIAQEATDSAEILAIPPTAQERYSMASFTGDGVLNRPFNHALFLFTDDTADALRAGLQTSSRANADPAQGAVLGQRWSPVLKNLLENASVRIATDLLAGLPKTDGFVAAALGTGATRFDMIIDPREPGDQVSIGQSVRKDGMVYQEVWSRFPARTFRNGSRKRVGFGARIDTYDLDVSLDDDLEIDVTASAKLTVTEPGRTAFPFGLSGRLQVTEITVNGTAAEFLHEKRAGPSSEFNYSTALLVLPEAPEPGTLLDVRFRYQGSVVEHTTNDVYLVGSRTSWYPRGEFEPSNYRLTFHYPANLDLRATGVLRETTTEGERRTSLYETEQPIRLAGFNLGRYVSEVREVGGYRLEILANRELESRFQPREQIIATPPPPTNPRRSPMNTARQTVVRISPEATPTPVEPIGKIADAVKSSFEYFLSHLGPPVSQAVSVTPVPNGYGQGFPGLVYAPTLSYLHVDRPPMTGLTESQRAFYKESLFPHEISHQWWGNRVIVDDLSDTWLVEALATYSALLYLEEKSGPGTIGRFLNYYLTDLQEENQEGEATESAGPIVLGDRLTSSRFPNAMATIVYGKGAWILHMIRTAIGPESFAKLLAGLATEFAQRPLSTDDFREAAAAYLPAESPDPEFKEFFDQWVYGTGMPRLTVRWSQKQGRVTGEIEQEDVPDYFAVPVTLEFQTEGEAIRKIVHTDGSATEFSFTIPQKVQSVRLDPDRSLLALIEQP